MDNGLVIASAVLGVTAGSVLLGVWVYLLYKFGVKLTDSYPRTWTLTKCLVITCLGWLPLSLAFASLPINWIFAIGGAIGLLGLNSYPTCIGIVAGRFFREQHESKLFNRNVDRWLGDWEARDDEVEPSAEAMTSSYDLRDLMPDDTSGENDSSE